MKRQEKVTRWDFEGVSKSGKVKRGRISAETRADALEILIVDGITPTSVERVMTGWNLEFSTSREDRDLKFKVADKAAFARQLYLLVRSGLQLSRAVEVIGQDNNDIRYVRLCQDLSDRILTGAPLSQAMANYPKCFDDVFLSYVRAGEVSGDIVGSLQLLAKQLERQNSLRLKVKAVTAYPKMMGGAILLITVGILMFLVPVYEGIYADLGAELPAPTRLVLAASDLLLPLNIDMSLSPPFVEDLIPEGRTVLTAPINLFSPISWALGAFFGWKKFREKTADNIDVTTKVEKVKFGVPVLGKLAKAIMLHRWATTLAGSLASGLSSIESLRIAADASGSAWMRKVSAETGEGVRVGKQISAGLRENPDLFDARTRAMAASGEEAGEVAEMFDAIAFTFEDEIDTQVSTLGARLEVGLLILMGLVVGLLLVALYMPIFSLADTVSGSYGE